MTTAEELLTEAIRISDKDEIRKDAGMAVANWFQESEPSEQEMLYVIAALISNAVEFIENGQWPEE